MRRLVCVFYIVYKNNRFSRDEAHFIKHHFVLVIVLPGVILSFNVLFVVTPIVGVCKCSMFCCTLLYLHSSIAIILMGKRELVALLKSSWCLVVVEWLFLAVPLGYLRFMIVVFPDPTNLLFLKPWWVLLCCVVLIVD